MIKVLSSCDFIAADRDRDRVPAQPSSSERAAYPSTHERFVVRL